MLILTNFHPNFESAIQFGIHFLQIVKNVEFSNFVQKNAVANVATVVLLVYTKACT